MIDAERDEKLWGRSRSVPVSVPTKPVVSTKPKTKRIPDRSGEFAARIELYNARKAAGICVRCGGEREVGAEGVLCAAHVNDATRAATGRRARYIAAGRCHDCGKPLGEGSSRSLCSRCRETKRTRNYIRAEKAMKAGKCLDCGAPRGKDGTSRNCRPCARKRADYTNAKAKSARRKKS